MGVLVGVAGPLLLLVDVVLDRKSAGVGVVLLRLAFRERDFLRAGVGVWLLRLDDREKREKKLSSTGLAWEGGVSGVVVGSSENLLVSSSLFLVLRA